MNRSRAPALTAAVVGVAAALAGTAWATDSVPPTPRAYRAVVTLKSATAVRGPLAFTRVAVGQVGRDILFAARTSGRWGVPSLAADRRRTLCLLLSGNSPAAPSRRVCLVARRRAAKLALAYSTIDASGRPGP